MAACASARHIPFRPYLFIPLGPCLFFLKFIFPLFCLFPFINFLGEAHRCGGSLFLGAASLPKKIPGCVPPALLDFIHHSSSWRSQAGLFGRGRNLRDLQGRSWTPKNPLLLLPGIQSQTPYPGQLPLNSHSKLIFGKPGPVLSSAPWKFPAHPHPGRGQIREHPCIPRSPRWGKVIPRL